jgi:hypothetical protein
MSRGSVTDTELPVGTSLPSRLTNVETTPSEEERGARSRSLLVWVEGEDLRKGKRASVLFFFFLSTLVRSCSLL